MTFTIDDVLTAMREAVKEKGDDYVYDRRHGACVYTEDDGAGGIQASCLIGNVINRLDSSALPALSESDQEYGGSPADKLIVNGYLPEDFWTVAASEVALVAQRLQDEGHPWGEALARAERFAGARRDMP